MVNLSDGSNWIKIYDSFHVAQINPNRPRDYYPILPILIPATLDNYIVAISCITTHFKPSWRLGAKVYPFIDINSSEIPSSRYMNYQPIGINETTILRILKLSPYYKLLIEVPRWFEDVHLEAWVFTGQEVPIELEDRINQIQTDLNRIELKIDSLTV